MDDIAVEEVQKQRVEQFDPKLVENTGFANFMVNIRPSSFGEVVGLGILNTSKNKDAAERWVKFLMSGNNYINYRELLTDPTFWNSFGITMLFVLITVFGSILVGLGVALLMNKEFPGRGIVRALILFPYVAPVISTVFAWQYVLMPLNGPLTILLSNLGIMDVTQDLVNDPNNAFLVVSFYSIWKNFPFIYLMILSRLQSISQDYYEAADIDGANGFQKFRHITLPELYYVIGSLVLLRGIWNFYKFEEVYLLSKEARTLPIYLYEKAFTGLPELGVAAAIATVLFVVMMVLISIYVRKVLKW